MPTPSQTTTLPQSLTMCATGCTDACPGEADGHPVTLCYSQGLRIIAEWNEFFDRRRGEDRTQMLPPGWVHEARLDDFEIPGIDMDLVRIPSRIVEKQAAQRLSYAEREAGVGGVVRGCWALVRRNRGVNISHISDHETNLWRLYIKIRDREHARSVNIFDEAQKSVAQWLAEVVAARYDRTDPAQDAEWMLHALSGQFRTPPPSTLPRP